MVMDRDSREGVGKGFMSDYAIRRIVVEGQTPQIGGALTYLMSMA